MSDVTLYHPGLDRTVTMPERSIAALLGAGWAVVDDVDIATLTQMPDDATTVDEVLAWVDNHDDVDVKVARAEVALEAELGRDTPRKTLVGALEAALGIDNTSGDSAESSEDDNGSNEPDHEEG